MRVVAIRGKDIASLAGEFAIELDKPPLGALGLFAIHGPVGAGKSTVLDALTLALYGRTPRLSGQGGAPLSRGEDDVDDLKMNDPRTLVRRTSMLAYAECDFTGLDGRVYRARWEVKRSKPKGGRSRLQPEKHSLLDVAANVRLGDTNTQVRAAIEERLGLSFEELCRSVLLAQGGFQGFLAAKPAERGELLEKVTGTAIYTRLSVAAHERARRLRDEEQALLGARVALSVFEPEERTRREAQAIQTSIAANAAEDAAARAATDLERARTHKAQQKALADAKAALAKARAASQAAEERHARADEAWTRAYSDAEAKRPLLDAARALDAQLAALTTTAATARAQQQHAQRAAEQAARALAQAERRHADLVTARAALTAKLNAAPRALAFVDVKDAVFAGLAQLARTRTEAEGARAFLRSAEGAVSDAEAARGAAAKAYAAAVVVKDAAIPPALRGHDLRRVLARALQKRLAVVDARVVVVDTELGVRRSVRERLLLALSKEDERKRLKEGEPCPLCGALSHPYAAHGVLGVVDDEERAIRDLGVEHRALLVERTALAGRVAASCVASDGDADDDGVVDADVDVDLAVVDAAVAASAAVDRVAVDEAAAVAAYDAAAERAAHAADVVVAKEGAERDVTQQLRALGLADDELRDPKALAQRLTRELRAIDEARAALVEHDAALAVVDAERASAAAAAAAAVARVRDVDEHVAVAVAEEARVRVHRAAVLADDVDVVAAAVRAACADADLALDAARRSRAAASAAVSSARAVVEERRAQSDAFEVDVDVDAAAAAAAAARAIAVKAREEHALVRAALAHDDTLVQKAKDLDGAIAAHQEKARVWQELASVIGSADGARFRQFAQSLTLDALVGHANQHLQTLAPRYRLQRVQVTQARHDLDLVVVDREAADEVRSTSTLSGGENFLVSLALALGLSSLSANEGTRGRVESLFIDEGFSALDSDTLDIALTAFDALRQTGRQIGVISHVPLLVERIGAQVRVIPQGGGASRIEVRAS